jgi:hypothetical protein
MMSPPGPTYQVRRLALIDLFKVSLSGGFGGW